MRVAVIGTGYVAGAYIRALHFLGYHPLVISRSWLNIEDPGVLRFCLDEYKPSLVINATGHHIQTVDDCQVQKESSYAAYVTMTKRLADHCALRDLLFVHTSSGCIFNGPGGEPHFTEEDQPNFISNYYQQCKREAEIEVLKCGGPSWIFRIRMPYCHFRHPRNWLLKLCQYDRIVDGLNSVTHLDPFAMRAIQMVFKSEPGIYHCAETVPIRTAQVAHMLFEAGLRTKPVELYQPADFLTDGRVARSEAVLDVSKFERAYGSAFGDPLCGIRWCIEKLKRGGSVW